MEIAVCEVGVGDETSGSGLSTTSFRYGGASSLRESTGRRSGSSGPFERRVEWSEQETSTRQTYWRRDEGK